MCFDIVTIFPGFFAGPLEHGIVRRAREAGLIETRIHDLREATHDRHRTVDDRPFGGGEGMVLKPEPLFDTVERILGAPREQLPPRTAIVLLSAAGKLFRQETAARLAGLERIVLLCGRYEGVDERVAEHLATDELSIGDYVVSGGELPAALVMDAVTRLLPGALGNEASSVNESFSAAAGVLEGPHYTRPQEFRGWSVPEVLVGGHHEEVRRWRRRMALEKTLRNRPEILESAGLSEQDLSLLDELREAQE
ncbi:MAG TPA: tRNA (guanosine(37)-N1)-methyltransferase TrmD [Candidatus Binatia bacterium]|nr:tRNA (guanosine(37)-N1)-methyltransferase TrmD [Candidatus Binatia bacterium]